MTPIPVYYVGYPGLSGWMGVAIIFAIFFVIPMICAHISYLADLERRKRSTFASMHPGQPYADYPQWLRDWWPPLLIAGVTALALLFIWLL